MSKEKYQTKTQLMLKILLDDAREDLFLSNQRMESFIKKNDLETLELERISNLEYKKKVELIEELLESEKNSYAGSPCFVGISYINNGGARNCYSEFRSNSLL